MVPEKPNRVGTATTMQHVDYTHRARESGAGREGEGEQEENASQRRRTEQGEQQANQHIGSCFGKQKEKETLNFELRTCFGLFLHLQIRFCYERAFAVFLIKNGDQPFTLVSIF